MCACAAHAHVFLQLSFWCVLRIVAFGNQTSTQETGKNKKARAPCHFYVLVVFSNFLFIYFLGFYIFFAWVGVILWRSRNKHADTQTQKPGDRIDGQDTWAARRLWRRAHNLPRLWARRRGIAKMIESWVCHLTCFFILEDRNTCNAVGHRQCAACATSIKLYCLGVDTAGGSEQWHGLHCNGFWFMNGQLPQTVV